MGDLPRPPAALPRRRPARPSSCPFGHRGANHPVTDLQTGRVEITSQNHGFAALGPGGGRTIDADEPVRWETDFGAAALSHVNLYDRTVEGLELLDVPGGTVQYHPEAGPGPHDSLYLFDRFLADREIASMPRRDDIHKILILGSGPIVIGQAAEFDYSGVQACKVLREEGYEVVLVNSNPATIMTDPEFADATYIEPLLPGPVAQVIERERPDALLGTLGGQTALNLAKALHDDGTLERFGVELIGANYEAIACAEDRELFARGDGARRAAHAAQRDRHERSSEARARARRSSACRASCARPSRSAGAAAGSRATRRSSRGSSRSGLEASPIGQVLLDESVIGWGEFELEVMRDGADNVVIVCSIENVDPMGVHTGDSVTVAPQQTLTDRLYQQLRDQAIAVIRAVGVETGGSNVQFAVNPETEEILVIEMNPRVSRSSALASKATGFPIAKIAARLAVGYRLDEIDNDITGVTPGLLRADDRLRRRQVAPLRLREVPRHRPHADDAHEVRRRGDGDRAHLPAGLRQGAALARARQARRAAGRARAGAAREPRDARGRSASRRSSSCCAAAWASEALHERTAIDPWFLHELAELARDPQAPFARRALVPLGGHLRGGVPGAHPLLLLRLGAQRRRRGPARRARVDRDPRLGAQPHRPGNRVRLLLRARRDDRARVRPRRGHDQLQPRDGLDRLRHLRPPLLRAAHARGRARGGARSSDAARA